MVKYLCSLHCSFEAQNCEKSLISTLAKAQCCTIRSGVLVFQSGPHGPDQTNLKSRLFVLLPPKIIWKLEPVFYIVITKIKTCLSHVSCTCICK